MIPVGDQSGQLFRNIAIPYDCCGRLLWMIIFNGSCSGRLFRKVAAPDSCCGRLKLLFENFGRDWKGLKVVRNESNSLGLDIGLRRNESLFRLVSD